MFMYFSNHNNIIIFCSKLVTCWLSFVWQSYLYLFKKKSHQKTQSGFVFWFLSSIKLFRNRKQCHICARLNPLLKNKNVNNFLLELMAKSTDCIFRGKMINLTLKRPIRRQVQKFILSRPLKMNFPGWCFSKITNVDRVCHSFSFR